MATTYKMSLDGTFSLADLVHLTTQVENLPTKPNETKISEDLGYSPYDYDVRRAVTAARRFKGTVSFTVEELPLQFTHPTKAEADAAAEAAATAAEGK